jgi:PAS domain-containing protein
LTADNPAEQKQLTPLDALATRQIENTNTAIYMRQVSGVPPADIIRSAQSERLADQYQVNTDKLRDKELRLLGIRDANTKRRLSQTRTILIMGTLFGLLVAMAAGWSALRDSSARRSAEEALRDSEEQHRILLNAVQEYALVMLSPQGTVVSWSAGAERITVTKPKK